MSLNDVDDCEYPRKGCTTVKSTANYYDGYFANTPPGSLHYAFIVEPGWNVIFAKRMPKLGSYGCCPNCIVTHIIVERIEPIVEKDMNYDTILLLGGLAVVLFMMLKK